MFSSFPQYLLLAPSFTNILNVYAFCNLHDVSWGTKGSDKAEALPSVSTSKAGGAKEAEEKMKPQEDVDAAFKETVRRALEKMKVKDVPEKPSVDDQNKTFRTRLVAVWMLTNAGLAVMIENLQGLPSGNEQADDKRLQSKQQLYFAVILYSTFVLALVRFLGVSLFYIYFTINLESDCVGYSVYSTSSSATSSGCAGSREKIMLQIYLSCAFVLCFLLCLLCQVSHVVSVSHPSYTSCMLKGQFLAYVSC